MAWNPSPKIAALRDAAAKFGWDKVVLIGINITDGTFETVTYGKTKKLCDETKEFGGEIHRLMATGFFGDI